MRMKVLFVLSAMAMAGHAMAQDDSTLLRDHLKQTYPSLAYVARYRQTFPAEIQGSDALWTADNEPIADRDVVLWYTMGTTHIPHPEEWPIMPATRIGFKLVPNGFFDRNPALDVPASGE